MGHVIICQGGAAGGWHPFNVREKGTNYTSMDDDKGAIWVGI